MQEITGVHLRLAFLTEYIQKFAKCLDCEDTQIVDKEVENLFLVRSMYVLTIVSLVLSCIQS